MEIIKNYFPDSIDIPHDARIKVTPIEYHGRFVREAYNIGIGKISESRLQYDGTTYAVWDSLCKVLTIYDLPDNIRAIKGFLYEHGFFESEIEDTIKLIKDSYDSFGRDCPLYIQF